MERFITRGDMQQASLEEAVANLFGQDAVERVRTESYAVQKKWRDELEADKRQNPEYYPDEDYQDGNYYGSTT
jgi:hypothetical protein